MRRLHLLFIGLGNSKPVLLSTLMANKYTAFPTLTPVQFYKEGQDLPDGYNKKFIDDGYSLADSLTYEDKIDYAQPWRFADLVTIQLESHLGVVNLNEVLLDALDLQGNVLVADIIPNWDGQLSGESYWHYQFKFMYNGYVELTQSGTQYIRFRIRLIENDGIADPTTESWLSEIQQFKEEQPGTLLVEYSHGENDMDAVFEQTQPNFRIRVEGDIHGKEPGSTTTAYTDMGERLVQLSAVTYNVEKFSVKAVPDYIIDKLNHILACDSVRIDRKMYVKDDGAKFELQATPNHPLKGASIQVRQADNRHKTIAESDAFTLWPQGNSTYPKYLYDVIISDGVRFLQLKEIILANSGAGTSLASSLNVAATAANNGTAGTFSYIDHALVYTQGPGETWASTSDYVFTEKLTLDVTVNINSGVLGWKDKGFSYGIDWGDSTIQNKIASNPFNPQIEIVQHTYASSGNYTVRIFHPGTGGWCNFNYPSDSNNNTHCTITDIAGTLPEITSQFFINGNGGVSADLSSMSASDFNFLQSARQQIGNIILFNCMITVDIGQIFAIGTVNSMVTTFPKLRSLTLTNNQLNAAEAANVINQFAAYCNPNFFTPNGVIRLKQKPPAVIVDAGALSTISVITNNPIKWTVEKD